MPEAGETPKLETRSHLAGERDSDRAREEDPTRAGPWNRSPRRREREAEVGQTFFFFFFMNGNIERAQCALSRVCIPLEKEKYNLKIKQFYKISKKSNKKNSCHLVPKVVIVLPFEGRLKEAGNTAEGRVPKARTRPAKSGGQEKQSPAKPQEQQKTGK